MKVDSGTRTPTATSDAVTDLSRRSDPARLVLTIAIGSVLIAAIALRFWTRSDLWFDEALSVNIARLPLKQIPEALRHDGHPPLYYFLLHFWIRLFGIGDFAVRSLSGVFAVATLPLAWYAGRRLGSRSLAWIMLVVVAVSPFAFRYATEARMYALVIFLVFAGYLALRRSLEDPSFGWLALVAVITGALALTQYWDLYLLAVVGAALAYRAVRAPDAGTRRTARRVVVAMGGGALLFVPWVPSFLDQLAHTGTPWGEPQYPWVNFPGTLIAFAGSDQDGEAFLLALFLLLLPLFAVFGRGLDRRRIEVDLRTQPAVRWEAATMVGALLLGTVFSYLSGTTYQARYAAAVLPLFLLVVAFGVTVFLDAGIRVGVVAALAVLGLAGGIRNVVTSRTQAAQVANIIAAEAKPGDLVAYCPDQTGPSVSRLLGDVPDLRLRQLTFPDFASPVRVNWRDYLDRVDRRKPQQFADEIVRRAGGSTIWYVSAAGLLHFQGKCDAIGNALARARPEHDRIAPNDANYEFEGLAEYPPQ